MTIELMVKVAQARIMENIDAVFSEGWVSRADSLGIVGVAASAFVEAGIKPENPFRFYDKELAWEWESYFDSRYEYGF